ncbi:MAG TPA: mersacidin/lichenicidin family type 2 lantibiotic [Thermoanaerobaculia bacterium]|jgi:mersacidin/lichenicidin family type 2 lantibiotic|nr:mersacidin/lichenicidin family type 2 lantibiotic [Thermoanaerobaculia bacterium]
MGNDVRAWKDPLYRERLMADGEAVFHPAGLVELSDEELKRAYGTAGSVETTAPECTFPSWRNWRACCP